jgi:DNA primase
MSRIPERLVQEILDKTDIVSVIGDHIRLMKKGRNWMGLCPFHAEKSPSFSVDQDKGLFYCFGCQKGGTAVSFLMELDKLSFPEAMEELARRAGVALTIEEAPSPEDNERKALFELYERLAGAFHWLLMEHPTGGPALAKLRDRGLPIEIIKDFRLGYAPSDRTWLHRFLIGKGYSTPFLQRSGLFAASSSTYPIFADRLMFPIQDPKARVIAFGGRLLGGEGPKYINCPDTALFRKQDNLFALDKALPAIKKNGRALICEGYMDALSFHAAGQTIAVAPLGTAFTPSQARMLKRWADKVHLCFDTDDAGQRAAERSCAIAAAAGMESFVVELPGAKDASEILEKEGPGRLQKTEDFTINGDEFLVRRAKKLFDIGTVEGKASAASFLYPYADALDSELKRYAFLEFASREFGANPVSLKADYEAAKRGNRSRPVREGDVPVLGPTAARTNDLLLMTAVFLDAEGFQEIRSCVAPEDLDDFRARDLYFALEEGFRSDDSSLEALLSRVEDDSAKRFVLEASASGELSVNPARLIKDGVKAVRRRYLVRKRERLISRIAGLESEGEAGRAPAALNDLLSEKMNLDAELEAIKGERDERP